MMRNGHYSVWDAHLALIAAILLMLVGCGKENESAKATETEKSKVEADSQTPDMAKSKVEADSQTPDMAKSKRDPLKEVDWEDYTSYDSLNFRNDRLYPPNVETPFSGHVRKGLSYFLVADGLKHGPYIEFHSNSWKKKATSFFREGLEVGPFTEYAKNGQVLVYSESCKGRKYSSVVPYDGVYKEYYLNGQIRVSTTYSEGKIEGKYVSYHEDGKPKEQSVYSGGGRVGLYTVRSSSGKLSEEYVKTDEAGAGVIRRYDYNGKLVEHIPFLNGKIHGLYLAYEYGKKQVTLPYVKGIPSGIYCFYRYGTLCATREYKIGETGAVVFHTDYGKGWQEGFHKGIHFNATRSVTGQKLGNKDVLLRGSFGGRLQGKRGSGISDGWEFYWGSSNRKFYMPRDLPHTTLK